MLPVTLSNLSDKANQPGTSLFIQPNRVMNSSCKSVTMSRFQQIDSLWNTRFLKALKRFNGAETFLRCLSFLGIYGNARRKSFQRTFSYSLFSKDTQKPRVSSAIILEGVTCSCLPKIRFEARVIYLLRFANPGVFGNMAYQSSRPVMVLSSRHKEFLSVTSRTERDGYIASDNLRLH